MKTALVTGANRGLGLEFVYQLKKKGYAVIGCCRNPLESDELNRLADEIIQLDVTNDEEIIALKQTLGDKPIDLLVNNAGTSGEPGVTVGNIERKNFLDVFNVNCVSVAILCDALLPNLLASQDKNILVVSSQMSSISYNNGKSYAYRASKAALNSVMRSFALDTQTLGIHIMLIHPGWVQTQMGGVDALINVETSVANMLLQAEKKLSVSHADKLYRFNGGVIPW